MLDNKKILIVDDNTSIHDDFKKILTYKKDDKNEHLKLENDLFGYKDKIITDFQLENIKYDIHSAFHGEEALKLVKESEKKNNPFALVYMDILMPPGWDGLEAISKIWEVSPNIEVVICSAYSIHSWEDIISKLGSTDRLLFLKKPFDSIEVQQMTLALVKKWNLSNKVKSYVSDLENDVNKRTRQLRSMVQELMSNRDNLKKEISIREKNELNLIKNNEIYLDILNSIDYSAILFDEKLNILFINSSFINILDQKKDDILNLSLDSFVVETEKKEHKHFKEIIETKNYSYLDNVDVLFMDKKLKKVYLEIKKLTTQNRYILFIKSK